MKEIEGAAAGLTTDVVRTEAESLLLRAPQSHDGQFKLVWRDGIDGADTVIVDPEALSKAAGRPHAIMDFAPSRDGRLLAYSIQVGGGEIGTLHVIDVASGKPVIEPIDRIRYASTRVARRRQRFLLFAPGRGLREAAAERALPRPHAHFLTARRQRDRPMLSPSRNPELKLPSYASAYVFQIPGTQMAAATMVFLGVERNRMLFPRRPGKCDSRRREVAQGGRRWTTRSARRLPGGWLYLRSSKSAPRYQVLRMPLDRPDIAKAET